MYEFERKGREQFEEFRNDKRSFYLPIKMNKFQIFEIESRKNKTKNITRKLKQDCALFSNLFIVCQTRELDLDMFVKHENQAFPPAISNDGNLYPTQKSNIVSLLESYCDIFNHLLRKLLLTVQLLYIHCHLKQEHLLNIVNRPMLKKFANSAFSTVELMWSLTNINMTV